MWTFYQWISVLLNVFIRVEAGTLIVSLKYFYLTIARLCKAMAGLCHTLYVRPRPRPSAGAAARVFPRFCAR